MSQEPATKESNETKTFTDDMRVCAYCDYFGSDQHRNLGWCTFQADDVSENGTCYRFALDRERI